MCEAAEDEDMEPPVDIDKDDTETAAAFAKLKRLTSGEPRGRLDQA